MLSYRAWQQQYGSDPSIIGSSFILDGHPVTIIGITPPGFFGETLRSDPPELWVPLQQEPLFRGKNSLLHQFPAWLRVIGRLRPGASVQCDARAAHRLLRTLAGQRQRHAGGLDGGHQGRPAEAESSRSFPREPALA